jgi:predicted NUDIX family NTP pyrophosphohydrolase
VAKREFKEETGYEVAGNFIPLLPIRLPSKKIITVWAVEGDCDASQIKSNIFTIEWPPRSGKQAEIPEVDKAGWFSVNIAIRKLLRGQMGYIKQLCEKLEDNFLINR